MRVTIVLLAIVLGCGGANRTAGISDTQFIDVMTELRRAAQAAGQDTARFMELRAEVLETRGVTEVELRAYVDARSTDLAHMAEIWDSVGARLTTEPLEPVPIPVVDSMPEPAADSTAGARDTVTLRQVRPRGAR